MVPNCDGPLHLLIDSLIWLLDIGWFVMSSQVLLRYLSAGSLFARLVATGLNVLRRLGGQKAEVKA